MCQQNDGAHVSAAPPVHDMPPPPFRGEGHVRVPLNRQHMEIDDSLPRSREGFGANGGDRHSLPPGRQGRQGLTSALD